MTEKAKPRILMLTSTLPRWEGDSEPRFVLDLAKHLSDDFDIELLAPHAPGAARSEVLEGVRVTRFRYWIPRWQSVAYEGGISWRLKENRLRLLQVPFFMLSLGWHILRRLSREPRVDLIHAHWIVPQGLVAVIARGLARRRVPVVCTSHGGDLFGLRGRMWTAIKRWVLRRCDAVTVVSNAMAERVREIAGNVEPAVIPMGTDLRNLFVPPKEPRKPPFNRLIFVGRLVEKKGVTHLLDAIADVRKSVPDTELEVIGHGPLREELEFKTVSLGLGGAVHFRGPVPHSALPEHYRQADIAVFPFVEAASGDQEGFGLVMVEAMGCGCAVIASELPAVRYVVRDGETGLLVTAADASSLARGILSLLESPDRAYRLAERAQHFAKENFDWSVSAEKFRRVYQALINGKAFLANPGTPDGVSHSCPGVGAHGQSPNRRGHAATDLASRSSKARKIESLLNVRPNNQGLRVLEIGTGSGGIANYFGKHPLLRCEVDAVDVSDTRQVLDGYRFNMVDGVKLPFPNDYYDIVISNHVVEHVGDDIMQRQHLEEIRRVLKPEGIGYLAVPNRWQIIEPHYRLAFLSWLPPALRTPYVRLRRRGPDYDCRPLTVRELEPVLEDVGFDFRQEHARALRLTYELEKPDAMTYRLIFKHVPDGFFQLLRQAFPTLIYLLRPIKS